MRYVLGIDGGGSKVACLAANDKGQLLGYGRGGAINTNYVLFEQANRSMTDAIKAALAEAGLGGEQVDCLVISAPINPATLNQVVEGCNISNMTRAAEGESSRWAARFWIDQRIGITVDAGTGSLSRGWTKDGRESGAGGFGATLGDEGSGVWIGMKAISAVLQAYDGRLEETKLTEAVLEHFGIPHVQDFPYLVWGGFITTAKMIETRSAREQERFIIDSGHILESAPTDKGQGPSRRESGSQGGLFFRQFQYDEPLTRHEIARLCPVVVEVARAGDRVALTILEEAGVELGRLAIAVIERLGMKDDAFAIVPFGGVFKAGEHILKPFRETCLAVAPRSIIAIPKFEPEVGAVLIALNELGVAIDDTILGAIEQSSTKFPLCRW